jgi:hypothetical protein
LKKVRRENIGKEWGIFSMAIPGRVGYQCSNFYRLLIKQGRLVDEKYEITEEGEVNNYTLKCFLVSKSLTVVCVLLSNCSYDLNSRLPVRVQVPNLPLHPKRDRKKPVKSEIATF